MNVPVVPVSISVVLEEEDALTQTPKADTPQPVDPANIPLPDSPLLLSPNETNPFEPTPENTLDRAPTTESIETEPSLSNTDETIDAALSAGGHQRVGGDEAIVTPVTSLEGGSESGGRLGVVGVGSGFDERE